MLSRTSILSCVLIGLVAPLLTAAEPSVVKVVKNDDGFQLRRNGEPYFIKGVGGDGSMKLLATVGGNSVRTWGADKLGSILDEAQKNGLTVTVGIWLGHERHGFNYNDADQVAKQSEAVKQTILRYKDHPAVLMWGLGNEMEGYEKGDNAAIWSAINNLANLAKKLDPNHPTMTVVAEIGGDRVKNIHRLCPDIDVIGINCYAGLASLPKRYKEAGGTKPYVVTEFGPPGVWETKKNEWGSAPEPTSTEKADLYRKGYEQGIAGAKGQCLGSYAFHWGSKQEATATWFGLLLPDGSRLGAVDALTELWTGKAPANRCPVIDRLKLDVGGEVEPGATVEATLAASDPDNDPLKVKWVLRAEPDTYAVGGASDTLPTIPDAIVKADDTTAQVKLPKAGGNYRLYAYVTDDHGGAAVANVPVHVKGPAARPDAKRAKLPLVLYDEAGAENPPYIPSGFMGNLKALKLNEGSRKTQPHGGKTCIRIDYTAKNEWGGIVWQHPENDWGDLPGGWDLTGAKKLTFWARGDKGGETVNFEFGLLGKDKKFSDTGKGKLEKVQLTKEWKQYSIDVSKEDLKRIKTGFACTVAGTGEPMAFYLDDIRFE